MKTKTVKKHVQHIASSTLTGKPFMGGAFFMHDTMGFPLGLAIEAAEQQGVVVSIPRFVEDARKAGWADVRIAKTIREEFRILGRFGDIPLVLAAAGLSA